MEECGLFTVDVSTCPASGEDMSGYLPDFEPYDLVVDGSDNFPTRYLVNDACVLLGKPYVYGAVDRWDGQASVFGMEGGPCYRCLFREPPPPGLVPSCAEAGVLGVLPGIIGSIQAAEAIKIILGVGESLSGRLLIFNALAMDFREVGLKRIALLPCNPSAAAKYEWLGRDCTIRPEPQTAEQLAARLRLASEAGLEASIA